MKIFISLICLIASFISLSAQKEEKKNEIQATTNYGVLSKKLGTWKPVSLNFRHNFSKQQALYGFYQKAYRSDITNDTTTIGYYQSLSGKQMLTDSFGIHYRTAFYRQGDFYNRGGTTPGVIYRF